MLRCRLEQAEPQATLWVRALDSKTWENIPRLRVSVAILAVSCDVVRKSRLLSTWDKLPFRQL